MFLGIRHREDPGGVSVAEPRGFPPGSALIRLHTSTCYRDRSPPAATGKTVTRCSGVKGSIW